MRGNRLAGFSFTMLVALFLVMSMGTSVAGIQPGQPSPPARSDSPKAIARSPAAGPTPPPGGRPAGPNSPSYQRLTPTTKRLYTTVGQTFGARSIGGWRAVGSVEGSDHPHGRAIDVMVAHPSPTGRLLGWRIARWAVASAERFDVKYVIFNGRIWTRSRGWHGYRHPSDPCNCNPTLRHDDHVHISVRH